MSYEQKYLKYKTKYLQLKSLEGGGGCDEKYGKKLSWSEKRYKEDKIIELQTKFNELTNQITKLFEENIKQESMFMKLRAEDFDVGHHLRNKYSDDKFDERRKGLITEQGKLKSSLDSVTKKIKNLKEEIRLRLDEKEKIDKILEYHKCKKNTNREEVKKYVSDFLKYYKLTENEKNKELVTELYYIANIGWIKFVERYLIVDGELIPESIGNFVIRDIFPGKEIPLMSILSKSNKVLFTKLMTYYHAINSIIKGILLKEKINDKLQDVHPWSQFVEGNGFLIFKNPDSDMKIEEYNKMILELNEMMKIYQDKYEETYEKISKELGIRINKPLELLVQLLVRLKKDKDFLSTNFILPPVPPFMPRNGVR